MKPSNIRVLSPIVANQIAAGEVVERPASVVKELLENALDAGATHLVIEVSFGGLNAISISDNGEGIAASELSLALQPHATSKIRLLDDLSLIQTMGFRGEALASIASVARVTIQSKPADQAQAMQLVMNGGEQGAIEPCARNQGTTVKIRDLFYNAPVRKRFLKSARTEFLAIDRVVRCLALSICTVSIDFINDGKRVFLLPVGETPASRLQRVQKILGKSFVEAAIPLAVTEGNLQLSGWLAGATYARSQLDRMWTYVNRRFVNDKLINHAIRQAYEAILPAGRYPACLLYIDIPPEAVDVNVHPTKHELRFHEPRMVHDTIRSVIASKIADVAPVVSMQRPAMPVLDIFRAEPAHAMQLDAAGSKLNVQRVSDLIPAVAEAGARTVAAPVCADFTKAHTSTTFSEKSAQYWQDVRWMLLSPDYALIERQQTFMLLDVCRLQRDCLRETLQGQAMPLAARALFMPIAVDIVQQDLARIETAFADLAQVGLTLSWLGELRILVRSIPICVPQLEIQPFIFAALRQPQPLTVHALCELLVRHQRIDLQAASALEKQQWLSYLALCEHDKQRNYLRILSAATCAKLFNERVHD